MQNQLIRLICGFLGAVLLFITAATYSPSFAQTTVASEPTPTPSVTPLNPDVLFDMVNAYRAKYNLPAFEKNEQLCILAASRSTELYSEIFISGPMHKGLYNRNLPYRVTENMIHMRNEQAAFVWWKNSWIHNSQMLGNYKYSCTACKGKSCCQLFSNFTPKITPVPTATSAATIVKK